MPRDDSDEAHYQYGGLTDMNDKDFIIGLMRENYEALGFIPSGAIENRYIKQGLYVVQHDLYGRNVGYVLHGVPCQRNNFELSIFQACIDIDKRNRGFGELAVNQIIERAKQANVRRIRLGCADDLESNSFWQAQGFTHILTKTPDNQRKRAINIYTLDLWRTLFDLR